ncbi:MAG: AraC family transcriptional regulator [Oenococcus sp.]|uniref:helix-turn-helix transcriptional regulator n=1 Tax=Oenococcus sp. TaxID=1979414 RepID=UPI0039ED8F9C
MKALYEINKMKENYPLKIVAHKNFFPKPDDLAHRGLLKLHWHRSLEIVLSCGDDFNIWKEGDLFTMANHKMLVINSGENHEFRLSRSNHYDGVSLIIAYDFLKRMIPNYDDYWFDANIGDAEHRKEIEHWLIDIRDIYLRQAPWDSFLLLKNASMILYNLFEFCSDDKLSGHTQKWAYSNRYKDVISYIDQNFKEDISLTDVAKIAKLNSSFFSRDFKQYLGLNFKDYLEKIRMQQAVYLLLNTNDNIETVSIQSGFRTSRSFIHYFEQNFNTTPTNYRKLNGRNRNK